MRVNGGDFTKNVTGSIGDGYTMYSFQPSQRDSFTDYGSNYRFSTGDKVQAVLWVAQNNTSDGKYTNTFYTSGTSVTLM